MAYDPSKIRLFIDQPLSPGADIVLTGDQVHYLRAVMRQREGDRLHAFNGRDGEWTIALTALGKKSGAARAEASIRAQSFVPDLWLVFAPVKGARLDFIVQKATELGAAALVPALTDRTIVRNINEDRLRANAVEAAEQCECLGVPEVQAARPLRNILGDWPEGRGLIFCDEGGDRPALETLQGLRGQGDSWAVLTGPEGGFTDAERDMIRRLPRAVPISLGPRIMRADTAAVAALSLFQATLGDWATPPRSGQV